MKVRIDRMETYVECSKITIIVNSKEFRINISHNDNIRINKIDIENDDAINVIPSCTNEIVLK